MASDPGDHSRTAALPLVNGPRPVGSPLRTRHSRVILILDFALTYDALMRLFDRIGKCRQDRINPIDYLMGL